MKVRVLGCSGGIGGRHLRTTALLVDQDVLIDCGTGVGDLALPELALVDHVFLTHAHLDHVACLPLLLDTAGDMRDRPLIVHALDETIDALRRHIFSWAIWPDFTQIPSPSAPYLRFEPLRIGEPVVVADRRITALPACHTVPAVGYRLDSGAGSLVFSGDTGPCPELWAAINGIDNLRHLIVETAFSNRERRLAAMSKHLCPSLLAEELARLTRTTEVFITHLKPGQSELTMREIEESVGEFRPRMLQNDQVFEF
jgi:ribonuclease BN (tRNA processing enzyme)